MKTKQTEIKVDRYNSCADYYFSYHSADDLCRCTYSDINITSYPAKPQECAVVKIVVCEDKENLDEN